MTSTEVDALYRSIGKLIRAARDRADITQEDLARRVGLTRTSITNIERGRQKLLIHTLFAIAQAVGVSPVALLPASSAQVANAIEATLPEELPSPEREWVKRILAPARGEVAV